MGGGILLSMPGGKVFSTPGGNFLAIYNVAEVKSHDHVVLQCLDIVIGAICFRLNDKHKIKQKGMNRRGNRTIAKEKLYKSILRRIRDIYPNFNIGTTTGRKNGIEYTWLHPYRHWRFIPSDYKYDKLRTKQKTP